MHCLSAPSIMIFGNNSHGPNNNHAACRLSWRCHHCSKPAFSKLATIGTQERFIPLCKGSDSGVGRICLLGVCQHMPLVSVRQVHVSALPGQLALRLGLLVQLASQEQNLLKV